MSLSSKNGWTDRHNRVYIYFTLEEAMERMGCGRGKAVRLFAQLDSVKGIGLIERKKQGLGKPARIYVKNLLEPAPAQSDSLDFPEENAPDFPEGDSPDFPEGDSPDFPETDASNTENNKTEYSQTERNHPSADGMDGMGDTAQREQLKAQICYNIEEEVLRARNPSCDREIDQIILLMTEVAASKRSTIRLDQQQLPQQQVKERLLTLQCEHIEYVLECMQNSAAPIHNIRAYLLTALYHAPETIDHYYAAQLNAAGFFSGDRAFA